MHPMERRIVICLMVLLTCLWMMPSLLFAEDDDVAAIPNCPICGMDRQKFAHSRILIHYTDGSQFGACSLHCAALELAYHPGKIPDKIEVADLGSKVLTDAASAIWVIGGNRMGVMTTNAKWAFADGVDAQQFVAEHGGKITDFETAISAAYTDMYADTRMIRDKRQKMKHMQHNQKATMSHGQHAQD